MLGLTTCRELARAKARVVMVSKDSHIVTESADQLSAETAMPVESFPADVTTDAGVAALEKFIHVLGGTGFALNTLKLPLAAMNAALWNMTRALSVEMAPFVRVNAVCGAARFDTFNARDGFGGDGDEIALSAAPPGREGGPDEVAAAIMYLAADTACSTTGTLLTVGGEQA